MNQQQSEPDKRSFKRTQVKVILRKVCILLIATFLATLPSILYQASESQASSAHASVRPSFQALLRDPGQFPPSGWSYPLPVQWNDWQSVPSLPPNGMGSCGSNSGGYQIISSGAPIVSYCYYTRYSFSEVAFQVMMQITAGDDGGIVFNDDQGNWYVFKIYQDKHYSLDYYTNGTYTKTLVSMPIPISIDPTQPNPIGIVVQNSTLSLYVNGAQINSQQLTFSSGWIGLIAEDAPPNTSGDVLYSNAQIWLPSNNTPTLSGSAPDAVSGTGPGDGQ